MIRLLIYILALGAFSFGASWFASNDGGLVVEWLGYRIETSLAFAVLVVCIAATLAILLIQLLLWVKNLPTRIIKARAEKKREVGLKALTEGFTAIAAGDIGKARRLARKTVDTLGNIPLTQLLSAQTAQLAGDTQESKRHYTSMLENKETELIALKGLLIQARKEGNTEFALFLAQKAAAHKPDIQWAHQMLIDLYKGMGRWAEAQTAIEEAVRKRMIDSESAKRDIAILYLARARQAFTKKQMDDALIYAMQCQKQLPDFTPTIVLIASVHEAQDQYAKALKVIESAWRNVPTSELATLYLSLLEEEPADKALKRAEKLAALTPDNAESHLLVARAALDDEDYATARSHLKTALQYTETRSACYLMATLEEKEHKDVDAVQRWKERALHASADPEWACRKCGHTTQKWDVTCSHCKSFDSYEWRQDSMITVTPPAQAAVFEVAEDGL